MAQHVSAQPAFPSRTFVQRPNMLQRATTATYPRTLVRNLTNTRNEGDMEELLPMHSQTQLPPADNVSIAPVASQSFYDQSQNPSLNSIPATIDISDEEWRRRMQAPQRGTY